MSIREKSLMDLHRRVGVRTIYSSRHRFGVLAMIYSMLIAIYAFVVLGNQ